MAKFVVEKDQDRFEGNRKAWMNRPLIVKGDKKTAFNFYYFYNPKDDDRLLKIILELPSMSGSSPLNAPKMEILLNDNSECRISLKAGVRTSVHQQNPSVPGDDDSTMIIQEPPLKPSKQKMDDDDFYLGQSDLLRISNANALSIRIYENNDVYYDLDENSCKSLITFAQIFYREVFDEGKFRSASLSQMTFVGKAIWSTVACLLLIVLLVFSLSRFHSSSSEEFALEDVFESAESTTQVTSNPQPTQQGKVSLDGFRPGTYVGTISGSAEARMDINQSGKGTFGYDCNGTWAKRKIEVKSFDASSGRLLVTEYDLSGNYIGEFNGLFTSDTYYKGTFTNYKGVSVPFNLYYGD